MKVIIAGDRERSLTLSEVHEIVTKSGFTITEFVSGGARGVDASGELYAKSIGQIPQVFDADWTRYGRRAGPIRNAKMAAYADALIAVPGSGPGTYDMIDKMKALGKPVFVWEQK
jgi:hypothetical protein